MSPDEIRQVYTTGPEAVIALVTHLLDMISEQNQHLARQSEQLTQFQQQNQQLTARVQALETQLAKKKTKKTNSHNSGKPPSRDGLKKPAPKSLRAPSGKRPGGQPGHPGTTLCWNETPDQVTEYVPVRCVAYGERLTPANTVAVEKRQVHDLPPLRLQVAEHQVHTCCCPACHQKTKAAFPVGVEAPVQYGPQVKALGVYLTCYQLLPIARTAQLLHDLLGVCLSPGTLSTVQKQCSVRLEPVTEQIKTALTEAKQVQFDETGARVAGRLHWLHVATTPQMTYYSVQPKRGRQATDAIGILPLPSVSYRTFRGGLFTMAGQPI